MTTLAQELIRRAHVQADITRLSDDAKRDPDFIINLLRAQLMAELWEKNEYAKARYDEPIADLIGTLEARIRQMESEA